MPVMADDHDNAVPWPLIINHNPKSFIGKVVSFYVADDIGVYIHAAISGVVTNNNSPDNKTDTLYLIGSIDYRGCEIKRLIFHHQKKIWVFDYDAGGKQGDWFYEHKAKEVKVLRIDSIE